MKKLLLILSATVFVAGCQTAPHPSTLRVLDNHTFMNLWSTYQRCMTGSDLDQLRADVSILMTAPQSHASSIDFKLPLPDLISRHVSAQPTRTAADPKAMQAACSLHTAEVATESGKNEVAEEILNGLLRSHTGGEYAYYIQQAKANLNRMQPAAVFVGLPARVDSFAGRAPATPATAGGHHSPAIPSDNLQYE